jgi:hypothetical protein
VSSFIDMDPALVDAILHSRGYTDAEISEIFQRTSYMRRTDQELETVMRDVTEKHNARVTAA